MRISSHLLRLVLLMALGAALLRAQHFIAAEPAADEPPTTEPETEEATTEEVAASEETEES